MDCSKEMGPRFRGDDGDFAGFAYLRSATSESRTAAGTVMVSR